MRHLVEAAGVDFDQWKALSKAALKVDFRTSSFVRAQFGAQAKAIGALIGQLIFYSMMGGFIAIFVWISGDLFLSGTLVLTYVMFMVGTATLLDHNAAITSPDDHGILGFRPVTSRTYFAARLTNVLVYTTAMTTLFAYLPVVSYFVRHGIAVGVASAVAVGGASVTATLTMVVTYAWMVQTIGPARLKRVLSYVQFVFSFIVYGGYFLISQVVAESALASFKLDKSIWLLLYPPTWFASYLELAAGRTSWLEAGPAMASLLMLVLLVAALGGRLSLDYADRLGAIASASTPRAAPARTSRAAWWFRAGEARAVALLIRSQFRNDMKFRMGVLAILPLTIIYLFIGLREGELGDPFAPERGRQGLTMVTLAMLMFPAMLKANLGRSDAHRASWVFFACPVDRARLVRSAKDFVVAAFLIPYLVFVGAVLAYLTGEVLHLVVHLVYVALLSHLILQLVTFLDPELPFSKPLVKGRSSSRVFVIMFVVGIGAVLMPIIAPLLYRRASTIVIGILVLIAGNIMLDRLTRLRAEAQAAKLEFEG